MGGGKIPLPGFSLHLSILHLSILHLSILLLSILHLSILHLSILLLSILLLSISPISLLIFSRFFGKMGASCDLPVFHPFKLRKEPPCRWKKRRKSQRKDERQPKSLKELGSPDEHRTDLYPRKFQLPLDIKGAA